MRIIVAYVTLLSTVIAKLSKQGDGSAELRGPSMARAMPTLDQLNWQKAGVGVIIHCAFASRPCRRTQCYRACFGRHALPLVTHNAIALS